MGQIDPSKNEMGQKRVKMTHFPKYPKHPGVLENPPPGYLATLGDKTKI
jgi:hypothetical protein